MPADIKYTDTIVRLMITFQEAKKIAEGELIKLYFSDTDSLIIIDNEIIEKEYAWIFPYTSKKFYETKDFMHAIGGNGPLFISKTDGKVSRYRTGLNIDGMIDEYEEENKVWTLFIADNTFADTQKSLAVKTILGLTNSQFVDLKTKKYFQTGSIRRLSNIQQQLSTKNIQSDIKLTTN
jgi:hypothetical protein